MSNTPNIDNFLAYAELMKISEDIENCTYEEACELDEKFHQLNDTSSYRAIFIMKAALAIEEALRIGDYEDALDALKRITFPPELMMTEMVVNHYLWKVRRPRKPRRPHVPDKLPSGKAKARNKDTETPTSKKT